LVNLNANLTTIGNFDVKNVSEEEGCRCKLSSSYVLKGYLLLNKDWIETRWNKKGDNITGNALWKLVNK
jgi:hypothetical protein